MAEENGIVFISDDRDDPESFVPISRENLEKLHVQMIGFDQAKSDKGFFTVSFQVQRKLQIRDSCDFGKMGQIRYFFESPLFVIFS